jgi:hypothetical protein
VTASERRRRGWVVGAALLAGLGYGAWRWVGGALTPWPTADGVLGVLLGLFICSHPAASAVDWLFFDRGERRARAAWAEAGWLALNAAALAVGWAVIVSGAIGLAGGRGG